MKKCEKGMERKRAGPWPGGTSHSLKIESIWKVCFSATQMCINWPHHITGPSEWDRVSVRTRKKAEKPHERRRRLHLSFWHCNSQSSKLSSLESSICFCGLFSLIVCPTFFFFLIESRLFLNTILQKRLCKLFAKNISLVCFQWKAAFSLLSRVDAWVQKSRYCCKCTVCLFHNNSAQSSGNLSEAFWKCITFKPGIPADI